jgi:hypothetical protein
MEDILYSLIKDPDSYWIIYDLCLQNNWAFSDQLTIRACNGLIDQCNRSFIKEISGYQICRSYSGHTWTSWINTKRSSYIGHFQLEWSI